RGPHLLHLERHHADVRLALVQIQLQRLRHQRAHRLHRQGPMFEQQLLPTLCAGVRPLRAPAGRNSIHFLGHPFRRGTYSTRMASESWDTIVAWLSALARSDRDAWAKGGWEAVATVIGGRAEELLQWARDDRRWSFVVAEASAEICAKPPEAAAWVL